MQFAEMRWYFLGTRGSGLGSTPAGLASGRALRVRFTPARHVRLQPAARPKIILLPPNACLPHPSRPSAKQKRDPSRAPPRRTLSCTGHQRNTSSDLPCPCREYAQEYVYPSCAHLFASGLSCLCLALRQRNLHCDRRHEDGRHHRLVPPAEAEHSIGDLERRMCGKVQRPPRLPPPRRDSVPQCPLGRREPLSAALLEPALQGDEEGDARADQADATQGSVLAVGHNRSPCGGGMRSARGPFGTRHAGYMLWSPGLVLLVHATPRVRHRRGRAPRRRDGNVRLLELREARATRVGAAGIEDREREERVAGSPCRDKLAARLAWAPDVAVGVVHLGLQRKGFAHCGGVQRGRVI